MPLLPTGKATDIMRLISVRTRSRDTTSFMRNILPILLVTRNKSSVRNTIQRNPKSTRTASAATVGLRSACVVANTCCLRTSDARTRCSSTYDVVVNRVALSRSRWSSTDWFTRCGCSALSQWKWSDVGGAQSPTEITSARRRLNLIEINRTAAYRRHLRNK